MLGSCKEVHCLQILEEKRPDILHQQHRNDILETIHMLSLLYDNQGKLAEAERMYLQALEGKHEVLGPKHISTLRTINNLGLLYYEA